MNDGRRPRIGIPIRLSARDHDDPREQTAARIFDDIVALVERSAAEAVRLGPDDLERLDRCDGFVLPGGGDVDPARYGGPVDDPRVYGVDPRQDDLDVAVLAAATDARRPVLGICRGLQLINVARGGSLHVDLTPSAVEHSRLSEDGLHWSEHVVETDPTSRIGQILPTQVVVACGHHQAVDRPAGDLRVTARAADGGVEAAESTDPDHWLVAVQWHPEADVTPSELSLPLFAALTREALRPTAVQ